MNASRPDDESRPGHPSAPGLSIAPMMEWTDRHYRYMMRLLTKRTRLYTEMVVAGSILYGDKNKLLDYNPEEHPLALQLGGDEPAALAESARVGEDWGYDEINLNVGCPSDRVRDGRFGACLMARPERVAECVAAMNAAVNIPVTVKCRIGIDGRESYADLAEFVRVVSAGGCGRFIVHARIAVLGGLSPAENRTVPPLRYADVYRLKSDFPELTIEINGGIRDLATAQEHRRQVDGVMIGRAAYEEPWLFARADADFFDDARGVDPESITREDAVLAMLPYIEGHLARGGRLPHITRHMINLFHGQAGARGWRRHLSENAHKSGAGIEVVRAALARVPESVRRASAGAKAAAGDQSIEKNERKNFSATSAMRS